MPAATIVIVVRVLPDPVGLLGIAAAIPIFVVATPRREGLRCCKKG
jgi:hypothetical protein